jgi:hypothetical protein
MHTHTLKKTTTLLFDGADFFRAIGDPNQISPFIAIGLIIIYVLYKLASAKAQGNKQQQIQEQRIQQQKLEKQRMEQMKNFYFIKHETGNISKPLDKSHVIEMLNRGEVNLQTSVRKGIDNHDFKPLKSFQELIENMNDFV